MVDTLLSPNEQMIKYFYEHHTETGIDKAAEIFLISGTVLCIVATITLLVVLYRLLFKKKKPQVIPPL